MQALRWGALLAAALALCGCDNSSASSQGGSSASSSRPGAGPKRYAADELPEVGERLPPLDEGRVEFASPKGWRLLSRDRKYLARFVKGKEDNALPRITVSLPIRAPEGIDNVTEDNASDFAAKMEESAKAVKGRKLLEPERPIILGDYVWSRHVRHLKGRSGDAAVQSLATARGGRLYLIELTVDSAGDSNEDFSKAIMAYRNTAYAVAASWKFLGDEPQPAAEPAEKEGKGDGAAAAEEKTDAKKPGKEE